MNFLSLILQSFNWNIYVWWNEHTKFMDVISLLRNRFLDVTQQPSLFGGSVAWHQKKKRLRRRLRRNWTETICSCKRSSQLWVLLIYAVAGDRPERDSNPDLCDAILSWAISPTGTWPLCGSMISPLIVNRNFQALLSLQHKLRPWNWYGLKTAN